VTSRTEGPHGAASVPGSSVGDPVRTVFLGSGGFGVPALRRLAEHPAVQLVGVVTAPPRPVGRRQVLTPTPIGTLAAELGLVPVLTPARLRAPASIAEILALGPGLAVLADYGQIVPPALLGLPHGALNLHPSALPRWRGAAPIPATILAGDRDTAVTIMRMDAGLDTGPVVALAKVPLTGDEQGPDLEARLAEIAAELLVRSLGPWLRGELPVMPQPADGIALTRPLRREDGRLDPAEPASVLERQVRAYLPWPGSFLEVDGQRLVVSAASVGPSEPGDIQGTVVNHDRRPALATVDGRLVLEWVTPEGKRPMTGEDWLRGRRGNG
jgi:methionyl-tRNA formyltransferase